MSREENKSKTSGRDKSKNRTRGEKIIKNQSLQPSSSNSRKSQKKLQLLIGVKARLRRKSKKCKKNIAHHSNSPLQIIM